MKDTLLIFDTADFVSPEEIEDIKESIDSAYVVIVIDGDTFRYLKYDNTVVFYGPTMPIVELDKHVQFVLLKMSLYPQFTFYI